MYFIVLEEQMKIKKTVISLSLIVSFFAGNCYAYNEDLFQDATSASPKNASVEDAHKKMQSPKKVFSTTSSTIQVDKTPISDPRTNKIELQPIPDTAPPSKKMRLPSAFEDNTPVAKMVDYNEYLKTQKKVDKPKPTVSNKTNETPEQYVDNFFDYNQNKKSDDTNQMKVNDNQDNHLEQNINTFFEQYNKGTSKPTKQPSNTDKGSSLVAPVSSPKTKDPIQSLQQPKVMVKDKLSQGKSNISLIPIPETLPKRQYIPHAIRGDKVDNKYLGSEVYIRIFKEEHSLELYLKQGDQFNLANVYDICTFYGGLGPKKYSGDNKSPEGFYRANIDSLQPNSSYYKAINIGFPNEYDRTHGYTGKYLMIHGGCKSIGCYAMTNDYIKEIYKFVQASFRNGQRTINIDIFPFRMTDLNLAAHRASPDYAFWKQLQPGYQYFEAYKKPPDVDVEKGKYVVNLPPNFRDTDNEPLFAKN